MKSNLMLIKNFLNEDSGQDLIEYALVAALVALGSVAALGSISTAITTAFSNVGNTLSTAS